MSPASTPLFEGGIDMAATITQAEEQRRINAANAATAEPPVLKDATLAALRGMLIGTASIPGIPGDILAMVEALTGLDANVLEGTRFEGGRQFIDATLTDLEGAGVPRGVREFINEKPATATGRYAQTISEYVSPFAIAGGAAGLLRGGTSAAKTATRRFRDMGRPAPSSRAGEYLQAGGRALTSQAVPAAAGAVDQTLQEIGGPAAQYGPLAGLVTALGGQAATGALRKDPNAIIAERMPKTPEGDLDVAGLSRAQKLMELGQQYGIPINASEAIKDVTGDTGAERLLKQARTMGQAPEAVNVVANRIGRSNIEPLMPSAPSGPSLAAPRQALLSEGVVAPAIRRYIDDLTGQPPASGLRTVPSRVAGQMAEDIAQGRQRLVARTTGPRGLFRAAANTEINIDEYNNLLEQAESVLDTAAGKDYSSLARQFVDGLRRRQRSVDPETGDNVVEMVPRLNIGDLHGTYKAMREALSTSESGEARAALGPLNDELKALLEEADPRFKEAMDIDRVVLPEFGDTVDARRAVTQDPLFGPQSFEASIARLAEQRGGSQVTKGARVDANKIVDLILPAPIGDVNIGVETITGPEVRRILNVMLKGSDEIVQPVIDKLNASPAFGIGKSGDAAGDLGVTFRGTGPNATEQSARQDLVRNFARLALEKRMERFFENMKAAKGKTASVTAGANFADSIFSTPRQQEVMKELAHTLADIQGQSRDGVMNGMREFMRVLKATGATDLADNSVTQPFQRTAAEGGEAMSRTRQAMNIAPLTAVKRMREAVDGMGEQAFFRAVGRLLADDPKGIDLIKQMASGKNRSKALEEILRSVTSLGTASRRGLYITVRPEDDPKFNRSQ